jgi:SAM-dependent methyltransferase
MAATGVSQKNAAFWDELCGTHFAREHGIRDHSPESLRRFDEAYLAYYAYLMRYVRPEARAGQRVLEIGLGYGTVGQKLAEAGALYLGLDIARGPVAMMNERLDAAGLRGLAVRGDVLHCPVASGSLDCVVSIGCLHHTGDLPRALEEVHRVLRPGGEAVVMVYNLFSYKSWGRWPLRTLRAWRQERRGEKARTATEVQRAAFDANSDGKAAPETVLVSSRRLRELCSRFSRVEVRTENCSDLGFGGSVRLPLDVRVGVSLFVGRRGMIRWLGPRAGLDLYLVATR